MKTQEYAKCSGLMVILSIVELFGGVCVKMMQEILTLAFIEPKQLSMTGKGLLYTNTAPYSGYITWW